MQPKIVQEFQLVLMGMSFYGDPFDTHAEWDAENQIGHLWKRLMRFLSGHPDIVPIHPNNAYEVHIYHDETIEKGLFEVFVGVEVNQQALLEIPVALSVKVLPSTQYAVFTFHGEQINSDWDMILQEWLRKSGYQSSYAFNFQFYDERFKGVANIEESDLDVYVPIKEVT